MARRNAKQKFDADEKPNLAAIVVTVSSVASRRFACSIWLLAT
jgi:hypothetical protein